MNVTQDSTQDLVAATNALDKAARALLNCQSTCNALRVLAGNIRAQFADCPVQCEIALGLETLANEMQVAEEETF